MPSSPLWLIAYDIADPGRLRDVAQILEDHGRRLQQSVFLCNLSGTFSSTRFSHPDVHPSQIGRASCRERVSSPV